jgi:hypothetical protein
MQNEINNELNNLNFLTFKQSLTSIKCKYTDLMLLLSVLNTNLF